MSNNRQEIIDGINQILRFLGSYGGRITIEEDWQFSLYVHDYGSEEDLESGEYEIEMASSTEINGDCLEDPLFRIVVRFDEAHERIVSASPVVYWSNWPGGWVEIHKDDNIYDSTGNKEHVDGELEERLCSYLKTITQFRPYLTNPTSVERFDDYF